MNSPRTGARPRSWAVRTSASIAALAVGAIGVVGFATAASSAPGCAPADAVTHTEHTYTRTTTQWAATSPGAGWTATGNQTVIVDTPAVTSLELEYRKWNNGQDRYDYKWYRQDNPPNASSGWELSGVSRVVIEQPAVTHVEYEYSMTETTGWLTESPGSGWSISDTRTVTDKDAVVCDDPDPTVTASGLRFRPGQTVDLLAEDFLPGEDVEFVMHSKPAVLGRGPANQVGTAAVPSVSIPANAPAGWHTIVATGLTSGRTASTPIEVLAADLPAGPDTSARASNPAPAAPAATGLAETGNESFALLGLAGSLALVGAGMVGMRRRPALI